MPRDTWILVRHVLPAQAYLEGEQPYAQLHWLSALSQRVWEGYTEKQAKQQLKLVESVPVPKGTTYEISKKNA